MSEIDDLREIFKKLAPENPGLKVIKHREAEMYSISYLKHSDEESIAKIKHVLVKLGVPYTGSVIDGNDFRPELYSIDIKYERLKEKQFQGIKKILEEATKKTGYLCTL